MVRVETLESERVYNQIQNFSNSLNWDGNKYIGNTNDVQFLITPSMSTRSIYVKIGSISKEMKDKIEIRISDHQTGVKSTDKDFYFTFENFDIEFIKSKYNEIKK